MFRFLKNFLLISILVHLSATFSHAQSVPSFERTSESDQFMLGDWKWQTVFQGVLLDVHSIYYADGRLEMIYTRPDDPLASPFTQYYTWQTQARGDGTFMLIHISYGTQIRMTAAPQGTNALRLDTGNGTIDMRRFASN